jgi:hypothetical protein
MVNPAPVMMTAASLPPRLASIVRIDRWQGGGNMKASIKWAARVAAWGLGATAVLAQAAPVSVARPFFNLEFRGVNSLGWTPGEFVRFGANGVSPLLTNSFPADYSLGTVGWVTKDGIDSNTWARRIWADPLPINPNFASRYFADDPFFRGNFTLHFRNTVISENQVDIPVRLDPNATHAPKIENLTLSGTGDKPTFTWSPSSGAAVNGYRVNIFDRALALQGLGSNVASTNLPPNVNTYTVLPQHFTNPNFAFQFDKQYVIEISIIQTKDGQSNNLQNDNVQAIARSYADFTRVQDGGPVVNLPVIQPDGSYLFNMTVEPGQTYFIDPEVAIGYDYAIGAGNPNFASVDLPDNIGDGIYDIFGFDAAGNLVLLADDWDGRDVFAFGAGGVDRFRVLGIETNAGLDPLNATAFITGLTFTGAGQFTGTQTPITVTINDVPAPPTLALLVAALGAAGWQRRRRQG